MKDQSLQPRGVRTRISQIDAYAPVADKSEGKTMNDDFRPLVIEDDEADIAYEKKRNEEVAEVLERTGVERIKPTVQAPVVNAVLDSFYNEPAPADEEPPQETDLPPLPELERVETSGLKDSMADIARPPASLMVPENGSNGLDVPPIFAHLATYYGKELNKEDVRRTIEGFRDSLAVLDSKHDEDLVRLEMKGSEHWLPEDMKFAGDIRRFYKSNRNKVEHARKTLKNKALRTGQLVDGEANALKDYCSNREDRAEHIEKHLQIVEAAKREALKAERLAEITPYLAENTPLTFDLGYMPDDQYGILLEGMKAAHAARQQAVRDAEATRITNEEIGRAQAERDARKLRRVNQLSALGLVYRADLEQYTFADTNITVRTIDVDTFRDDTWAELIDEMTGDIGDINDVKAEQQRIDAENARIAQGQLDKIEADKAEADRKVREAALAPDREKLLAWLDAIDAVTEAPDLNDALLHARALNVAESVQTVVRTARGRIDEAHI